MVSCVCQGKDSPENQQMGWLLLERHPFFLPATLGSGTVSFLSYTLDTKIVDKTLHTEHTASFIRRNFYSSVVIEARSTGEYKYVDLSI